MAHWSKINDDNVVTQIFITDDNDKAFHQQWLTDTYGGRWIETSFNTFAGVHTDPETHVQTTDSTKAFRKNYGGIGYTYDDARDAFIPPKRFASWILDEETCVWVPPIAKPDDGQTYRWDEQTVSWVVLPSAG